MLTKPNKGKCNSLFNHGEPDRTLIMGILNITPDSFYDGGEYLTPPNIINKVNSMVDLGADIIDVGAESTRPGSDPVPLTEELKKIDTVLENMSRWEAIFSIDTSKPKVAIHALKNGFHCINDVTGGGADGQMFQVAADFKVPIIIMHMLGTPQTMQNNPEYDDIIDTLKFFFEERIKLAKKLGLTDEQIILDPGIGFGKRVQDNDLILRRLSEIRAMGYPILIGVSRKSFLARGRDTPADRLSPSIASMTIGIMNGADMVRVHDVKETVLSVQVVDRIKSRVKT